MLHLFVHIHSPYRKPESIIVLAVTLTVDGFFPPHTCNNFLAAAHITKLAKIKQTISNTSIYTCS